MRTASIRHRLALALAACLPLLAGCGGDDEPAGLAAGEGEIRFSYAGVATGSFAARGTFDADAASLPLGNWSVGARDGDTLVVGGLRARTAPNGDFVGLFLPGVTGPVTKTVSFFCSEQCPLLVLVLNADLSQGDPTQVATFDWACLLVDGTIRVDALSASRARGTFSGSAGCLDEAGMEGGEVQMMTIANGRFDVPITDAELPIGELPVRRQAVRTRQHGGHGEEGRTRGILLRERCPGSFSGTPHPEKDPGPEPRPEPPSTFPPLRANP